MEVLAIALSALALVFALRRRPAPADNGLEDARQDARRRVDNLGEELRREIAQTRRAVAELARGERLDPEQVLEGRLWRDVDEAEARALLEGGRVHVVDVRTPAEVETGILPGAICIPVDQLPSRLGDLPRDDRPTLVYCAGGGRSAAACEYLEGEGRRGLLNLTGGISSWRGPRASAPRD